MLIRKKYFLLSNCCVMLRNEMVAIGWHKPFWAQRLSIWDKPEPYRKWGNWFYRMDVNKYSKYFLVAEVLGFFIRVKKSAV